MTMYNIISPDGIPIRQANFRVKKAAIAYFLKWVDGYRAQGYYSSVSYGRIAIPDLPACCQMINRYGRIVTVPKTYAVQVHNHINQKP
jgi:hypothetical protein